MGVFPAASGSHVPSAWAELMKDPVSLNLIQYLVSLTHEFVLILGITNHRFLSGRFQNRFERKEICLARCGSITFR